MRIVSLPMIFLVAGILATMAGLNAAAQVSQPSSLILPQPQITQFHNGSLILSASGMPLNVQWPDDPTGAISEAQDLLTNRLQRLGSYSAKALHTPALSVRLTSKAALRKDTTRLGMKKKIETGQENQIYYLKAMAGPKDEPAVSIQALTSLGLYYGMNTFCQLLTRNEAGELVIPSVEILDYPDIAFRLAKSSASHTSLEANRHLAHWLPLLKISQMGLQYHGNYSKKPEPPFHETIATLCSEIRRQGTLESIVYFCPYRGQKQPDGTWTSYDMKVEADQRDYAEHLRWFMAQGAHGVEVDYNDWPGSRDIPISDILNLAYKTVTKADPHAYVLYCPPNYGDELYHGMATPALIKTLTNTPNRLLTLWTGIETVYSKPVTSAALNKWTSLTNRKPVLWINRASIGTKKPLITQVESEGNVAVFRGEWLPKDLAEFVSGVHLNIGIQTTFDEETHEFDSAEILYLATVADYLWNPENWDAESSARRAKFFMQTMLPLMQAAN